MGNSRMVPKIYLAWICSRRIWSHARGWADPGIKSVKGYFRVRAVIVSLKNLEIYGIGHGAVAGIGGVD